MPHLHVGLLDFLTFLSYLLIAKALMLVFAARFHDTAVGRAVAALS